MAIITFRHRVSINNSVAFIARILGVVSRISVLVYGCEDLCLRTPIESDLDGCRISDFRDIVGIPLRTPEVD